MKLATPRRGIGEQLLLDSFQILGHRVDPRALGQAVVEQELGIEDLGKEQLGHLAEADDGRGEQPAAVASVRTRWRMAASSSARYPLADRLGIAGGPARGAQELHALQRRDVTEKIQLSSSEIAATENSEAQYSPAFSLEAAIG